VVFITRDMETVSSSLAHWPDGTKKKTQFIRMKFNYGDKWEVTAHVGSFPAFGYQSV
jgi:hypothetical protein